MRPQYFDIVNYSREMEAFRRIDRGNNTAPARIDTLSGGLSLSRGGVSVRLEYSKSPSIILLTGRQLRVLFGVKYTEFGLSRTSRASISGAQVAANFSLTTRQLPIDTASMSIRYTYSDSEAILSTRSTTFPERARHFETLRSIFRRAHLNYKHDCSVIRGPSNRLARITWQDHTGLKLWRSAIPFHSRQLVHCNSGYL